MCSFVLVGWGSAESRTGNKEDANGAGDIDHHRRQASRGHIAIVKLAIAEQTSVENQREQKSLLVTIANRSATAMLWYNSNSQCAGGRTGTELDRQAGMLRLASDT